MAPKVFAAPSENDPQYNRISGAGDMRVTTHTTHFDGAVILFAAIWILVECGFLTGTAEENRYGPGSFQRFSIYERG